MRTFPTYIGRNISIAMSFKFSNCILRAIHLHFATNSAWLTQTGMKFVWFSMHWFLQMGKGHFSNKLLTCAEVLAPYIKRLIPIILRVRYVHIPWEKISFEHICLWRSQSFSKIWGFIYSVRTWIYNNTFGV